MISTEETMNDAQELVTAGQAKQFSINEATQVGASLGIAWDKFGVEQFMMGLNVELEHGSRDPGTDVTHDELLVTGKIALAHLNEIPDYYTRLASMEYEAAHSARA